MKKEMKKILKSNDGFTLLSVLMAASVMGIVSIIFTQQQKTVDNMRESNEFKLEINKLELRLSNIFDKRCEQILDKAEIFEKLDDSPDNKYTLGPEDRLEFSVPGRSIPILYKGMSAFPYQTQVSPRTKAIISDITLERDQDLEQIKLSYEIYYIPKKVRRNLSKSRMDLKEYVSRMVYSNTEAKKGRTKTLDLIYSIRGDNTLCDVFDSGDSLENSDCGDRGIKEFKNGKFICNDPAGDSPAISADGMTYGEYTGPDRKEKESNCNNGAPIGSWFDIDGGVRKQEHTKSVCATNLQIKLDRFTNNGELEKRTFKQKGYYGSLSYEGRTAKEGWANCPENGSVLQSYTVEGDRRIYFKCAPLKLEDTNPENICSPSLLQARKENLAIAQELEEKARQLFNESNGDNYGEDPINQGGSDPGSYAFLQEAIQYTQYMEDQLKACQKSDTLRTGRVIASTIKSGEENDTLKCPKGYFLSGMRANNDKDDDHQKGKWKIRCSQYEAITVK